MRSAIQACPSSDHRFRARHGAPSSVQYDGCIQRSTRALQCCCLERALQCRHYERAHRALCEAGTHSVSSSKEFRLIHRRQFIRLLDARTEEIFMIPFHDVIAFRATTRSAVLSVVAVALVAPGISVRAQEAQLKTAEDRKSTRLNSSHSGESRMPSSA